MREGKIKSFAFLHDILEHLSIHVVSTMAFYLKYTLDSAVGRLSSFNMTFSFQDI